MAKGSKFKPAVWDFYLAHMPSENPGALPVRCIVAYEGRGKDTLAPIPQRFSFTSGVRMAGLDRVMCNSREEVIENLKRLTGEWNVPHRWAEAKQEEAAS